MRVERQGTADVQMAEREALDEGSARLQAFIGRDVVARSGDHVGRVSDLLVAPGGELDAVIITLVDEMGGQQVRIPADNVMVNSQDGTVLVVMDTPQITAAPVRHRGSRGKPRQPRHTLTQREIGAHHDQAIYQRSAAPPLTSGIGRRPGAALLAACGEDEVAEQETTSPPASTSDNQEAPAGVPSTLESTERAIEAVPPKSDGQ